ncbi:ferritin-like domain-containing protein [uncultured Duncaniella sp.]|jgi:ferritin-like metal-binding protein YciE|uniref:YciE/YciF ferroxidase family protein n=1 Tax=Bacteroides acidifaciens TaxID=85831 RepID=UPI00260663A1|nr:ferritin-like domain-containing protein [uncultured Duncaniella sp.]
METKTKKEATSKKEDAKSKAETPKKDVTASKADKKASADDQKGGTEFREFFIDELKDILWAEKALLKALPKMRKAATGKELAASFESHLSETENQISTLEQVFDMMGEKPKTKKCDAMEGLLSEAESIISDTEKGSAIRDAGLILAAQKVEHYEIATYGTLAAFADAMQEAKVAKLLRSILRDEKKSDKMLTILALESVNEEASEE